MNVAAENWISRYPEVWKQFFNHTRNTVLLFCDHHLEILDGNRTAREEWSSFERFTGRNLDDYLSLPSGESVQNLILEESAQPGSLLVKDRVHEQYLQVHVYPVEPGWVIIGEHLGRTENEIIEHMAVLTNQIANMTRELRQKNAALEKANERIEKLSRIDPLTNLANRRYFSEQLATELSQANRHGSPLSIIMTDLDKFKAVNDIYGHDAGDKVLQSFASVLQGSCRKEDLAVRFGGEEFLLIIALHQRRASVEPG